MNMQLVWMNQSDEKNDLVSDLFLNLFTIYIVLYSNDSNESAGGSLVNNFH